ncbi:MAG: hypothetical protein PVI50_02110, partial [Gammaproteobacteria bacterium]
MSHPAINDWLLRALLILVVVTGVADIRAAGDVDVQDGKPPPSAWERMPKHPLHTDHAFFFFEPFPDGPSVTRACLECHP